MAEREGFEPPIPVKVYTLARRAPAASRPSLRTRDFFRYFIREAAASNFLPTHWTDVEQSGFNSAIYLRSAQKQDPTGASSENSSGSNFVSVLPLQQRPGLNAVLSCYCRCSGARTVALRRHAPVARSASPPSMV